MGSFCSTASKAVAAPKSQPNDEETPGNPDYENASLKSSPRTTETSPSLDPEVFLSPSLRPTLNTVPLVTMTRDLPHDVLYSNTLVSEYLDQYTWAMFRNRRDSGGFGLDLIINLSWWQGQQGNAPELDLKTEELSIDEYNLRKIGCVLPSSECFDVFGEGFLYRIIERLNPQLQIDMKGEISQGPSTSIIMTDVGSGSGLTMPIKHSWDIKSHLRPNLNFENTQQYLYNNSQFTISIARNLQEYPFPSGISDEQRQEIKYTIIEGLESILQRLYQLQKIPNGQFYSMELDENMKANYFMEESDSPVHEQISIIQNKLEGGINSNQKDDSDVSDLHTSTQILNLNSKNSNILTSISRTPPHVQKAVYAMFYNETFEKAGICRDFPSNRIVWISEDYTIFIYINALDHFTIQTKTELKDFLLGYNYIESIMQEVEKKFTFCTHDMLGFLSSSLWKIGCGAQASISLQMPYSSQTTVFYKWLNDHGGRVVEHDKTQHAFLLTNLKSVGISEGECIASVFNVCHDWIQWEKELYNNSLLLSDVNE